MLSVLAAAAFASSGVAHAETTGDQRFMISIHGGFVSGTPTFGVAKAWGPVSGMGTSFTLGLTLLPDGSLSGTELLTFDDGSISLDIVGTRSFTFNPIACHARFQTVGTWSLSGGTDSFAGATGSGTFTTDGTIIGVHGTDGCVLEGEGVRFNVTDKAEGTAIVP